MAAALFEAMTFPVDGCGLAILIKALEKFNVEQPDYRQANASLAMRGSRRISLTLIARR